MAAAGKGSIEAGGGDAAMGSAGSGGFGNVKAKLATISAPAILNQRVGGR
jgi:hypothetical protein